MTSDDYMTARTGKMWKSDGTRFNETDFLSRVYQGMTSFNELGVSQNNSLINMQSVYPISKQRDIVEGLNGGNVTQSKGEFIVSTTSDPDSEILLRSIERGRYVAGYDSIAGIGIRLPERPTGNQIIEWGYTDFENGISIGEDADGIFLAIYNDGVQEVKKYLNFDIVKTDLNIFRIGLRWYGRGPASVDLAVEIDGVPQTKTVFDSSILKGKVFTKDPNQPISVRIKNNGTASALNAMVGGRQYHIRGIYNPLFRISSQTREEQSFNTTDFVPAVSIRQKSGDYKTISTKLAGLATLTSDDVLFQVRIFNDLTGAVWEDPTFSDSGNESAMEFDTSATAISGGIKVYEGIISGGKGSAAAVGSVALPNLELPNDGNIISLCVKGIGASGTATSIVRIREEW